MQPIKQEEPPKTVPVPVPPPPTANKLGLVILKLFVMYIPKYKTDYILVFQTLTLMEIRVVVNYLRNSNRDNSKIHLI